MDDHYRDLNDFLRKHKASKDDIITHTRIGNIGSVSEKEGKIKSVFPGKYSIPDDKLDIFYKLYNRHVFINKNHEYLTEKQRTDGKGPLLIDLDFRFDPSVTERLYDDSHITDLCDKYTDIMQKYLLFDDGDTIPCFVFQKPNVNTSDPKKTKDGLHILFGIQIDHTLQRMIRGDIIKEIDDVFEELPLTNDYEGVLDEGISKGDTNWQVYGSRKPDNEAYELIRHVDYIYNASAEDFQYNNKNLSTAKSIELLKCVSARQVHPVVAKIDDEYKELYDKLKPSKKKLKLVSKKRPRNAFTMHGIEDTIGNVNDIEGITAVIKELFDTLTDENYKLKEVHQYTMALPAKYYESYNEWIRVGWALHNCDYKLFWTWMLFSAKSDKFSFDDVPKYFDMWNEFKDEGVTERSIMYWLQADNPEEYYKIRDQTVEHFMFLSVKNKGAEWSVATVIYQLWKNRYRCASIKYGIWYEYKDNRWVQLECGGSLRNNISKILARKYGNISSNFIECTNKDELSEKEYEEKKAVAAKMSDLCVYLQKTQFKNNVLKEAATIFYEEDPHFMNRLDSKKHLIGFKNGVFDFEKKEFRRGLPEDYISLSTKMKYIPIDRTNEKHVTIIQEINDFMASLFPDENIRKYMWEHLASVLIGGNKPQTFNIYNGSGRNGKSKLVELMTLIFGEYKGVVPITLVTSSRQSIGGLSPEVAQLKGKRYAVMQEPKKGDRLNDGIMKELTGEDPIQARALYQDAMTFVPQFKLVVSTNNLFDIGTNDDGTWRRIRKVDFESKFVDNPNPTEESPFEFKIDRDIDRRFAEWKYVFMSMLIEIACETDGNVTDCPRVKEASEDYRKSQNYMAEFMGEKIRKGTETSRIKKTELYEEFKQWYQINYGKNVPKGREIYDQMDKKYGKYKNGWQGYVIIYEEDEVEEIEDDSD